MTNFPTRLAEIMETKGVTQQWLADQTGYTQATIARYKSGKVKPSFEAACKIADALKVKLERLR